MPVFQRGSIPARFFHGIRPELAPEDSIREPVHLDEVSDFRDLIVCAENVSE